MWTVFFFFFSSRHDPSLAMGFVYRATVGEGQLRNGNRPQEARRRVTAILYPDHLKSLTDLKRKSNGSSVKVVSCEWPERKAIQAKASVKKKKTTAKLQSRQKYSNGNPVKSILAIRVAQRITYAREQCAHLHYWKLRLLLGFCLINDAYRSIKATSALATRCHFLFLSVRCL